MKGSLFLLFRSKRLRFLILSLLSLSACSIIATRPIQEMANTSAAIRAAKEVQADIHTPELFQHASEIFFKAKQEYRYKNFRIARELAEKARKFAEQAEYESIRSGGTRADAPSDPLAKEGMVSSSTDAGGERKEIQNPDSEPAPYPYPSPEGIPAEDYDQRMKEQQQGQQQVPATGPSGTTQGLGLHPGQFPPLPSSGVR